MFLDALLPGGISKQSKYIPVIILFLLIRLNTGGRAHVSHLMVFFLFFFKEEQNLSLFSMAFQNSGRSFILDFVSF